MSSSNIFFGIGRRKSAVAQVRLTKGTGKLLINGDSRPVPDKIKAIFKEIDRENQFDISAVVRGGGKSGQIDAISLGVARALLEINPDFRSTLRKTHFLTRDPRVKERKKPGLKRARRAPQWAKR